MTTLPLRASDVPTVPPIGSGLARVGALVVAVLDVFADAQRQAAAAEKKYPFADW